MDRRALLERARTRGVNPFVYWAVRAILQPFFRVYWRLDRIGRDHIPASGPVILASNHRSFLDPFVIAVMARRPIYFMAKKELFVNRPVAWMLGALGAYPIDRGASDQDAMATTRAILERGDGVLIFPEGTRTRPGPLGRPKRGVGRLALETGAPVVPVAVIGTEAVRRGWRIRPHKVRIRAGAPLTFPRVERPSLSLAGAVTDRIWPCVELQWEWLGGTPKLGRAAVIGAGTWGTSLAVALARAGLEVDLGTRTAEHALALRTDRVDARHLPGVELPAAVTVHRAAELELGHHDLVCFAMPASRLPDAVAAHGDRVPGRAGVIVATDGLVAPLGSLPAAYVSERVAARAVARLAAPAPPAEALAQGGAVVAACADEAFLSQLAVVLRAAGLQVRETTDITGAELAATARDAAALAVAAAGGPGHAAAGLAADAVFAEVDAYARRHGGRAETFAGLDGKGDPETGAHTVPLLATALRNDGVPAPAVEGLADVVEGRVEPRLWAASVTNLEDAGRRSAA
jgi:1-acyl-sn-glycerol-3-phosphate acyltransferase